MGTFQRYFIPSVIRLTHGHVARRDKL